MDSSDANTSKKLPFLLRSTILILFSAAGLFVLVISSGLGEIISMFIQAEFHSEHCRKVSIGMSEERVIEIMGPPEKSNPTYFYYGSRFLSSCDIYVEFDTSVKSRRLVTEKFCDNGDPPCFG